MAKKADLIHVLQKLNINAVDQDWVKETWMTDFTEIDTAPTSLTADLEENNFHLKNLKQCLDVFGHWVENDQSQEEGFWTILVENDLPYKSLLALLAYITEVGQKRISSSTLKEAAITAAGVYFYLIRVPGSGAFKVYHPLLFDNAVKCFKLFTSIGAGFEGGTQKRKRRSSSQARSSQSRTRSKPRKQRREQGAPDGDPFADDDEEQEEDEEEDGLLSAADLSKIHTALFKLLKNLVGLLDSYSLRESEQAAHQAVQIMAELSRQEPETQRGVVDDSIPIKDIRTVPQLAYRGLLCLCSPQHGEVSAMVLTTFKYLLHNLLMWLDENKAVAAQTIPRSALSCRDRAVQFVCLLIGRLKKEDVLPAVRVLIQHMCTKVADRTEYRSKVAEAVVTITKDLPDANHRRLMEWFFVFSRNAKISYRVFAIDLFCLLLKEPERKADPPNGDIEASSSHHCLIQMLLSRCSDIAPTVRTRAITGFTQCMSSDGAVSLAVRDIMTPKVIGRAPIARIVPTPAADRDGQPLDRTAAENPEPSSNVDGAEAPQSPVMALHNRVSDVAMAEGNVDSTAIANPNSAIMRTIVLTPGVEIALADGAGVVSMMRRRAADQKVNVRKSAIQALESVIRLQGHDISPEVLEVIHDRCQDPALSVRKQAMSSLTYLLLEWPTNLAIQKSWLDGVLPLVLDREISAQEKCLETVNDVLIDNVVPYHRSKEDRHRMTWELLTVMSSDANGDLRRFLGKACQHWGREGKLTASVIASLKSHIGTEHDVGAWMLLASLVPFTSTKFNPDFILEYWNERARSAPVSEYGTVERVLTTISHVAGKIDNEARDALIADMKGRLMRFDSPPELIGVTVSALNKLCLAKTDDAQLTKKLTNEMFGDLLRACDNYLSKVILSENPSDVIDDEKVIKHLFTLGEIAQLCPQHTPKRIFMLVESLIAAPVITSLDTSSQWNRCTQPGTADVTSAPAYRAETPALGDGQLSQDSQLCSQASQPSSQASQPSSQTSQPWTQTTQVLSQFRGSKMSPRIRAHAFTTLGKLCLQNRDLAKSCVAALTRELETSPDFVIRNNVIIILCDLCVRYTSLVDNYAHLISMCVKDDSPLIRKQTITLLTHLLQEDFLKWKGSLFYHFISTMVDDVKEVRNFAEFCLVHLLLQRHPTMFYQHFVECIFFFNNYDQHSVYNKLSQTEKEKQMFSLKGKENHEKRMRLYTFMLEHMNDDHKFQLTAKLCHEVLGGIVDGVMPLDGETVALLQDALNILSCKEIKLASLRSRPQDDVAETEQEMAAVVMNAARKTIITQVFKRNVIENIVPTVISLKHMLERERSPVLKHLMGYLQEIMKDFKNEVKDVLAADKQLAKEIEFDLRRFQQQQEDDAARAARGSLTPGRGTPAASPRLQAAQSPGNGANKSPRVVSPRVPQGSPLAGTPGSLKQTAKGTPARVMSISTQAILNSARKAMVDAKKLAAVHFSPRANGSPRGRGQGQVEAAASPRVLGGAPRSATHPGGTPARTTPAGDADSVDDVIKTPEPRRYRPGNSRAISTPSVNKTFGNITFMQGEQNLSIIPPSPIPSSLPNRVYAPDQQGTPSWTKRVEQSEDGVTRVQEVLHLMSPDAPAPKPRRWNVQVTLTRPQTSSNGAAADPPPGRKPSNQLSDSKLHTDKENDHLQDTSGSASLSGPRGRRRGARRSDSNASDTSGHADDSIAGRTRGRRSITGSSPSNTSMEPPTTKKRGRRGRAK